MHVCEKCKEYIGTSAEQSWSSNEDTVRCFVCLGLWQDAEFEERLLIAIKGAMSPYGGPELNCLSQSMSQSLLAFPRDLLYRHMLACRHFATESDSKKFAVALKLYSRDILKQCIGRLNMKEIETQHPQCVNDEEQGYLSVYAVAIPTLTVPRPQHLLPKSSKKRTRRKFPDKTQGGDPRTNLESCLQKQGTAVWNMSQAHVELRLDEDVDRRLLEFKVQDQGIDIHVAVWRRAFYLRGLYTKSRRDVSQSPFFVVDGGKRRKLGCTSVEEQILPVISRYSSGISELNNDPKNSEVLFGMAKFHASGREDMDVRMLLPDWTTTGPDGKSHITGRPFMCEIIDAFRLPTVEDLNRIVCEINHVDDLSTPSNERCYGSNPLGVDISTHFGFASSSSFKNLQAETEQKVKYYACLCWSKDGILGGEELLKTKIGTFPVELEQRTPLRVLHRRPNLVRIRHVLSCHTKLIDSHHFWLHISTDAGTYVKEFVHGDLGRTKPSVSSLLGCKTDILQLDCEGIEAT